MKKNIRPSAQLISNIELLRVSRGWSKEETAKKLKIAYSTYQNYVKGRQLPGAAIIDYAAIIFNIPAWRLLIPFEEQENIRAKEAV